jgi:hypothetical protein
MRIRKQQLFADILYDGRSEAAVYHYIIQREGSNQILYWSQEKTEGEALQSATRELARLAEEHKAAG